jgi:hypothetical protein
MKEEFLVEGKDKVISVLFLTEHHAIKACGEVEVQLHAFLALALEGGEWSALRLGRFIPRGRAPVTH